MTRRRESNLTLDDEEKDVTVEIERLEQPWMTVELFETLWLNATQQVSSSCTFTKFKRPRAKTTGDFRSSQPRRARTEGDVADSSADADAFQQQILTTLGDDLVVFPPLSDHTENESFAGRAYASVVDNYATKTVLLVKMEQLHDSEQIGITVKNTDPVHRTRMAAFLGLLQQRIQPGSAPRRPQPRSADTSKLFLEAIDREGRTDSDSSSQVRTPPSSSSACVTTPPSATLETLLAAPRLVERGRSHTIRYRTDRDISFEGYLSKKSDVLMSWKAMYCVLEEDTLAFYETREDFISNTKLVGRIQLQAIEDEDMGKPNGFRLIAEGNHINHLSSRTAFEKEQWKRAISIAISKAPEVTRPYVAFASQPLEPHKFYRLLGALLCQEIGDFPLLFRSMHPDVVVTSNFPPIVPFWGQYRRYDGVLLFISTLLDTVMVDNFSLLEVIELVRGDADCIDDTSAHHEPLTSSPIPTGSYVLSPKTTEAPKSTPISASTPSSQWTRRLVVTGKETYNLLNTDNRRVTQLFVHELWLDHKDRLVRWHLNGDAVALSVAFDDAPRGENIRLVLPGEASAISRSIPPGTFYVQILQAQQLHIGEAGNDHALKGNAQNSSAAPASKKSYLVYARCILEEGTHMEQTLRGLDVKEGERVLDELAVSSQNGSTKETRRPSKGTRFFRGLRRAAGISGERAVAAFGDPSGCVTNICKCIPEMTPDGHHKAGTLSPNWSSNLRLEFPGCARGFTYFLKVEVFQSRFMLPDELLGVCKINVTPHLSLVTGSADAKANGALPRWHNLCDQYNDCKESWAPPTVFRGRIQLGIIFAPSVTSAEDFPRSQGLRRMASEGRLVESRRRSADEILLQSLSSYDLREFGKSDKRISTGTFDIPTGEGRYVSRQIRSRTDSSGKCANGLMNAEAATATSDETHELTRLARNNHTFSGKTTTFDVPKKYQLIKVVGAGTYGEVVAASDVESGTTVAIKKVSSAFQDLPDTKRILRELCLLRQLSHPNLIQLYDVPRPERLSYLEDIYLVTDLMETDLHRVIHSTQTLTDEHVAHFMRQILRALAYLHSANVLHRDLKPSNILVTSTCEAKICDLGLARYVDYSKSKRMKGSFPEDAFVELTEYVVTRWYRAPEILLDGCRYDKPSDLWSAGCILGELLGRKPLFPGSSTTNQLNKIFNVLGTPDIFYIAKIYKEAAQKWVHRQRWCSKIPFEELYSNANQQALDLLDKLLVYDPKQRITAVEALKHPYLQEAFRSGTGDNIGNDEAFYYDEAEQKEDRFVGKIDDSNEYVAETKQAMQHAVFEQVCHFHPEAREYEECLRKHDEKFCVDPKTGKLVPIKN